MWRKNAKKRTFKEGIVLGIIIGGIIFGSIGVSFAANGNILSKGVRFDNSGGYTTKNTVQGALDELYKIAQEKGLVSETSSAMQTLMALGITNKIREGTPDFTKTSEANPSDDGIWSMTDAYGTSYYYRGNIDYNYVQFADRYWRIIRVNGDGSLRMIYDGTTPNANGSGAVAQTNVRWNNNYNDAKYVGFMFGGANGTASTSYAEAIVNETDSSMKTTLQTWYENNLRDYSKYLSDNVFCNDRSLASGYSADTTGYAQVETYYGAYDRLQKTMDTKVTPTLICPQKNDAFTVGDGSESGVDASGKGNGMLKYPIGLITADEIIMAGGKRKPNNNSTYYLKKTAWYWSFSPYVLDNGIYARVCSVDTAGGLYYNNVVNGGGLAPVINLSAVYAKHLTGDGTASSPYVLGV